MDRSIYLEGPLRMMSWSLMIAGHTQNGSNGEAIDLFCRMIRESFLVVLFSLTSVASACSNSGILENGKKVLVFIDKLGHGFDVILLSAVIYMYAECGGLEDVQTIFQKSKVWNVVFWTSMIGSLSLFGRGRKSIELFELMLKEKIIPNDVRFANVLSVCSHAGLVKEGGYMYFELMENVYNIAPKPEHFTCTVDLLG